METGNKFVLFIVLSLSSILLYAEGAACAPKSFRYLEPSIKLSKETTEAPAPSTKSTPRPAHAKTPTTAPPSPPTPKATPTATDLPDGPELAATKTSKATPTATDSPDGPEPPATKKPKATPTATDSPDDGPEPASTKTPKATPKVTATDSPDDGPEPQSESSSQELKPGLFTVPTLPIQTTKSAPNPEVKKACDSTDNPLLCIQSIAPFLQEKFDTVNILESEMKAVQAHTQELIEKATKIAQDPSTAPDVAEGINYCKENYDSVISNLDEAIDAMATHDVGKMNTMLSAVFSDVSTCQDTFSEVTTSPSPLTDMETPIKDLASNCLALLSTMNWN